MPFARRPRTQAPSDPPADPYSLALLWLGRRELTERQIRQRLARLGTAPDHIDSAIERLRAVRALDDARVASAYARTAAHVKGRGRHRIARELSALGVGDALVKATLEASSPDEERQRLERALQRKARSLDLDDRAQQRKVIAALMRQGFDLDGIRAALRRRGRPDDIDE